MGHAFATVRSDPDGLKAYFVGAFQALPKLTVKFGDQLIRVYGDTASTRATIRFPTQRMVKPNHSPPATVSHS